MRSRISTVIAIAVATVSLVSCGDGGSVTAGQGSTAAELASAERLAELLEHPPADYDHERSMGALGAKVDVVAAGVLANPRSGRSFYGSPQDPYPSFRTITFDLTGVEVLGGARPELLRQGDVVVELHAPNPMVGDDGLAEVEEALGPAQQGLFFLDAYDPASTTTVRGEDPGLVYLVPHPQGAAFETAAGATVTPTDPIPGAGSMPFEGLVAAARRELAGA